MEELIKRLERVIQTGAPDKDGQHPISAEAVLEVVKELSELSTNLAEVGTDVPNINVGELISREQAIETFKDCAANGVGIDGIVDALKQLPPANCSEFPNNSDTISRQAAIDALERAKQNIRHNIERAIGKAICEILDEVENGIKQLPSAEPKRGKWIDKGWTGDWQYLTDGRGNCWKNIVCSECGESVRHESKFCPNCGAKMEVNHESN